MKKLLYALLLPIYCLAQVPQYYSTVNFSLTGSELKEELAELITETHIYELIYTPDVWNVIKQGDLDPENTNNVLLLYGYNNNDGNAMTDRTRDKDLSCHTLNCTGLWVREHTYPRSLGNPNLEYTGPGSDAHHLRAIDSQMNSSRSNRRFTQGSGNAGIVNGFFYPGDEWKGDVARMMMYMYLRYQSQCLATVVGTGSTTYSMDMPDIFLEWNEQDPVSQYELNRNNAIESMQGNRNPFIDNPYLATVIWGGPEAEDTWDILFTPNVQAEHYNVYPTLTTGKIFIDSNTAHSFTIYNSLGQKIKFDREENCADLTGNTPGIYFVNIQSNTASSTVKIILR